MNKLYRSVRDSRLTGLCGGIAEWIGANAAFVRFAVVIAALCSFGSVLLIYLLCSLVVPKEPVSGFYDPMQDYRFR